MLLSRRRFVSETCLAATALSVARLDAQGTSSTSIRTAQGMVRGEQLAGARVFRGVPFAQAPTGVLRFRPAAKPLAWRGERDATRFAVAASQPGMASGEDCLSLNVWAPEGRGPFPVYVWVHGGGFTGGTSFSPMFDGAQLAQEGIVTVTIAYRLGVFGFLDVSPLLGSTYAGSANNGLRDVIAALGWVQTNIAGFGGDPRRVTIGGESAGAKLTDTLMGTPAARPLFHQVISESGGAERIASVRENLAVANAFRDHWRSRFASADPTTATVATLLEAQESFLKQWPGHYPLRPTLDGMLLVAPPIEVIAQGATEGKRLLLGTNRDESALFVGANPAPATAAELATVSLDRFAAVAAQYARLYPDLSEAQRRIRALTAEEYWIPSLRVADAHRRGGGTAWVYRLDFSESSGRLKGFAYHSLDLALVWDRPNASVQNAPAEAALARQMHQAWVAFLRGETPAAAGLPAWTPYNVERRPTLALDTRSRMEENPQEGEFQLWDGVL